MSPERAVEILESLVDGIHPLTRKPLPEDNICEEIGISDALNCAIRVLNEGIVASRAIERYRCERLGVKEDDYAGMTVRPPENAGKRWEASDDAELVQLYLQGTSVTQLAKLYKRTNTAIRARLVRHGFAERQFEVAEVYSDIDPIDNDDLRYRLLHGESIPELAKRYNRTEKAIRLRLFYMGMGGNGPDIIPKRKEKNDEK